MKLRHEILLDSAKKKLKKKEYKEGISKLVKALDDHFSAALTVAVDRDLFAVDKEFIKDLNKIRSRLPESLSVVSSLISAIYFWIENPKQPEIAFQKFQTLLTQEKDFLENFSKDSEEYKLLMRNLYFMAGHLAVLAENKQQYDLAIKYFDRVINFDCKNEYIYYSIASCYFNLGKYKEALENYQYLKSQYPNQIVYYYSLKECYIKLNKYEELVKLFEEAVNLEEALRYENLGDAYFFHADDLFLKEGMTDKTKKIYGLAEKNYHTRITEFKLTKETAGRIFNVIGMIYFRQERYTAAIEQFENAQRMYGDNLSFINFALVYFVQRKYKKAIEFYEKVDNYQAYPQILIVLAQIYAELDNFEKCLACLDELQKCNSVIISEKKSVVSQQTSRGLEKMIDEINSKIIAYCYAKAINTQVKDQFYYLDKIMLLDSLHLPTRCRRGLAYLAQQEYGRAISELELVNKNNKNSVKLKIKLAEALLYKKSPVIEGAIRMLNSALSLNSNDSEAYKLRAYAYKLKNETAAAEADEEKARAYITNDAIEKLTLEIEIDSKEVKNYLKRGTEYYQLNLFDCAIKDFKQVLVLNPEDKAAREYLNKISSSNLQSRVLHFENKMGEEKNFETKGGISIANVTPRLEKKSDMKTNMTMGVFKEHIKSGDFIKTCKILIKLIDEEIKNYEIYPVHQLQKRALDLSMWEGINATIQEVFPESLNAIKYFIAGYVAWKNLSDVKALERFKAAHSDIENLRSKLDNEYELFIKNLHFILGYLLSLQKYFHTALDHLKEAKVHGMDEVVCYYIAACYFEQENYGEAIAYLKIARLAKPKEMAILSLLKDCYKNLKREEELLKLCDEVIEFSPNATFCLTRANICKNQAEKLLNDPSRKSQADVLYQKALEDYEACIDNLPMDTAQQIEAYSECSQIYLQFQNLDAALALLQCAILCDSKNSMVQLNIANVFLLKKNYNSAIGWYKVAEKNGKNLAEKLRVMVEAYASQKYDECFSHVNMLPKDCVEIFYLAPALAVITKNIINNFYLRGINDNNINTALELFNKILMLDPHHYSTLCRRGLGYLQLENYSTAIADLEHALKDKVSSGKLRIKLATAYFKSNKITEALHQVNLALTLDEYDAEAYKLRAKILQKQEDFAGAKKDKQQAKDNKKNSQIENLTLLIEIDADCAENYFQRGLEYLKTEKLVAARIDFKKALFLNGQHELAKKYYEKLINEASRKNLYFHGIFGVDEEQYEISNFENQNSVEESKESMYQPD